MQQLKLALRQLQLRPGLSVVVVLMLALGIGGTTAMFSLYHEILLKPLPVPEPERLVNLAAPGPGKPGGGFTDLAIGDFQAQFSYPMFRDLERTQTSFTGIAAHTDFMANLSFNDRPAYGRGALVSGSYFGVLGLKPTLGRLIGLDDDPRVGEAAVVVLSYDYWQNRFGGDESVIGQTLTVNGQPLQIIGVAPEGFTGTTLGVRFQVFVPLTIPQPSAPAANENRQQYWLYLFARLRPGVTLERAAAELNGVYSGILNDVEAPMLSTLNLPGATLEQFRAREVELAPGARGRSNLPSSAERPLVLLVSVTVLVLFIVCVNIANLLLARGASRTGEMAIRASLGASRGWLAGQLITESFVLIAIGGLMSLVVAAGIVRLIGAMLPKSLVNGLAPDLSGTAMLFAADASLATVLVFSMVPAWRASRTDPANAMRAHAARSSGGRAAVRFRRSLTTAQIAFSMLLLVLAGLFTRSLMNVEHEDLGMAVDSLVNFSVTPRLNGYDNQRITAFYDRLEDALAAQPGVRAVGSVGYPLLYNFALPSSYSVEGFETAPGADTTAAFTMIGSGFFDAMQIPVLVGRAFTDSDTRESPPVAVVNETFARKFELGRDVGGHLGFGTTKSYPFEIIGIVADAKLDSVKGDAPPVVYFPRRQLGGDVSMFYYVRADIDPEVMLAMIPRIVAEIDPQVPVSTMATMAATVRENVYIDRLLSMLSAGFAALATLLAGIGLYGVLAYNVTQRTREIGLRLALGAEPGGLRAMILKQVGVMTLIGLSLGLAAALVIGRVAEALLFGLSGRDPLVLSAAAVVLVGVVIAGSWFPARRASRIAPTVALRYE